MTTEVEVVRVSEARWGALNPARGSAGPRAANLWGDRAGSTATGFLVRFAEGFSSPPHIHNVTYRGIVIEGLVHNDDPEAAEMWMPQGSYWTQPAGEVHITSAKGTGRLTYIEIQKGPYLVMPPEEASDNGERPINVHAANMVWLDASTTTRIRLQDPMSPGDGPRISFLWGDPQDGQASGALVALPGGHDWSLSSDDPELRVVVIEGSPRLQQSEGIGPVVLEPGSFVGGKGPGASIMIFAPSSRSLLYVRCRGSFEVAAQAPR